jgi:hypothetical protein
VPASLKGDFNIVDAARVAKVDLHTFLQNPELLKQAAKAVGSPDPRLFAVAELPPNQQQSRINNDIVLANDPNTVNAVSLADALASEFKNILDKKVGQMGLSQELL